MELTKSQRRAYSMVKWSPFALLGSLVVILMSIWFGPYSPTHLLWSAMFGLIYTVLVLVCWKVDRQSILYWIIFMPTIFVVVYGRTEAESRAFQKTNDLSWWVALQYLSVVFAVFFLVLFVFGSFIRKHILAPVRNLDNAI